MVLQINKLENAKINRPILIEGLPGIGNVGKIAVDFIVDNLKARKIMEIQSYGFPHAVFVNDKNLVELPTIEIFHKKINGNDILLLAGDIQPIDEASCYEFCDAIIDLFKEYNGTEIITLGGIGLPNEPNKPLVFCTANSKKIIEKYRSKNVSNEIYGVVGPIIGVTGVLVGLAGKKDVPAIAFLAETYGHPNYIGIKGAREILKLLNEKISLRLNFKDLDKEVEEIEKEMKTKIKQVEKVVKKTVFEEKQRSKTNYIG